MLHLLTYEASLAPKISPRRDITSETLIGREKKKNRTARRMASTHFGRAKDDKNGAKHLVQQIRQRWAILPFDYFLIDARGYCE